MSYDFSGENNPSYRHGMHGTRIYWSWQDMKKRISNPKSISFKRYGGRGISLCEEWKDFINFYKDMGNPPTNQHTLERIDNNKGYNKENCRWATRVEQTRNFSRNNWITFNEETLCLSDWANRLGISEVGLLYRLKNWPLEKSLTQKKFESKKITSKKIEFNGKVKLLYEWANELGLSHGCLKARFKRGWTLEEAMKSHD